jgi:alpha-ribazole phosphatase
MIRLILVRHGETLWTAQRRYQGQTDVPLSDMGRRQAEALGRFFIGQSVDRLYSSDLQRAVHTAEPVSRALGIPVTQDRRLRETFFGEWEGRTYNEIEARWPRDLAVWYDDPVAHTPPGGERLALLKERVAAFVDDMRRQHKGETVVTVAHGGVIRAILLHELGLPSPVFWRIAVDAGSLSELRLFEDDRAMITLLNDCHALNGALYGAREDGN